MNAFYSLIYCKPNSATDELYSVAILGGGDEGPFIYISEKRMDLLKKILPSRTFQSFSRRLRGFASQVEKYRGENTILIFDYVYSMKSLTMLAEKTKGSLVFSEPTPINGWMNTSLFNDLVYTLLFERKIEKKIAKNEYFHFEWRSFYQSYIFEEWNRRVPLSTLVSDYPLGIKIDLFQPKKKELVMGINFDVSETRLRQRLYEIDLLVSLLTKYKLTIVYPTPEKTEGKKILKDFKKKHSSVKFQSFEDFKKKMERN